MDTLSCSLCSDTYERKIRDPVVLPKCGHTFCRPCLLNMEDLETNFKCAVCRAVHSQPPVKELPVNYIVIQMIASNRGVDTSISDTHSAKLLKSQCEMCVHHGDPKRLWCFPCKEDLCGQCLLEKHMGRKHRVVNLEAFKETKKSEILCRANEAYDCLKENKAKLSKQIKNCANQLASIYEQSNNLTTKLHNIENIMKTTACLNSIDEIQEFEKKLLEAHPLESVTQVTGRDFCHSHLPVDKYPVSWNEDPVKYDSSDNVDVDHSTRSKGATSKQEWQISCLSNDKGAWPSIPWEEFMEQIPVVQLLVPPQNPTVFMEIGVGTTILGQIHIKLWGKLRRAQHFLALCLGTFGQSYKGSKFCAVERKDQPGESIKGGDYLNPMAQQAAEDSWRTLNGVVNTQDL